MLEESKTVFSVFGSRVVIYDLLFACRNNTGQVLGLGRNCLVDFFRDLGNRDLILLYRRNYDLI